MSRRRIIANEFSTLFKVPQEQSFINLSFTEPLVFEKPLGKSKTPITIIPYVNLLKSKIFDNDEKTNNLEYGGDGRVFIGTGLNLDFTSNQDLIAQLKNASLNKKSAFFYVTLPFAFSRTKRAFSISLFFS